MYKVTIHLVSGHTIVHSNMLKESVRVFQQLFQTARADNSEWVDYSNTDGTRTELHLCNVTFIQWPSLEGNE